MKSDSEFIKKYKNRMTAIMKQAHPEWKEKDIEKIVMREFTKNVKNPVVTLDNNYTGESRDTTLMSVFDWILERKPLIAGNGTFYKNQHEALNPISKMLNTWAANRKAYKKEMFKVGEEKGFEAPEYMDLDRKQQNEKINMNSYYGASGAPSSAFYSKWSGPATTLTAQSVISTAETFFESFLADSYIYLNLTELIEWIQVIRKEDMELDDFIQRKSEYELVERLLPKILNKEENDREILENFVSNLTVEEITMIYYKNNMIQFFKDHKKIRDILEDILYTVENLEYANKKDEDWLTKIPNEYRQDFLGKSAKQWNKFVDNQYFMDPNDPPKNIEHQLRALSDYLIKYCYAQYLSIDRIYRLRNFKRWVVTVIDTDSNFLSLDTLINYLFDDVVKGKSYGRDYEHNVFIVVNSITYVITDAIYKMLIFYGKSANIPEEYRPVFNMKNEFFNSLLVIGNAKKRYISKQMLREGNLLNPPKSDIKGFDFKKATTSEYAEKVFMGIINDHILNSETIEVKEMQRELREFQKEIYNDIRKGEKKFLPNGSAKEAGAYKDPGTNQSYRAVLAWNILNPDNLIDFPSKVSLVKMNIFTEEDANPLKHTHPEIYNTIIDKIFNDTTGIFVIRTWDPGIEYVNVKKKEWWKDIPKKYQAKYKKLGAKAWNDFVDNGDYKEEDKKGKWVYKKRGLQVLAIPSNSRIPEWALPFVDYNTMINTIISPFKPVLEIFGVKFSEEGKTKNGVSRKTNGLTNIIKL